MRKFVLSLLAFASLASPTLFPLPAQAGCGFLDITCRPSEWTCPIGGCGNGNGSESGSDIQVVTPPTYYDFQVRNATNGTIYFSINGTRYSLPSGHRQQLRYQRTSGSSSGGRSGQHYSTTIRWDGDYAEGYQARSFTLPFSNYDSWYEFRSNSTAIYLH
jgi:hypothetical protein